MCYIVGNKTSHDYLTWPEAEKKCQRIGNNGHLVSIHSQSQQNFIRSLQRRRESIPMWIGLNDLGTEANYKWTDESTYNYSNWASGQPDNYFRKEDCIHLVVGTGTWNDNNCHENKYSYICKAYN
ncbi:macrophage mannose receptor 1-like, partial [Paramuricea clavata]